jgi:hypothetical protein
LIRERASVKLTAPWLSRRERAFLARTEAVAPRGGKKRGFFASPRLNGGAEMSIELR